MSASNIFKSVLFCIFLARSPYFTLPLQTCMYIMFLRMQQIMLEHKSSKTTYKLEDTHTHKEYMLSERIYYGQRIKDKFQHLHIHFVYTQYMYVASTAQVSVHIKFYFESAKLISKRINTGFKILQNTNNNKGNGEQSEIAQNANVCFRICSELQICNILNGRTYTFSPHSTHVHTHTQTH